MILIYNYFLKFCHSCFLVKFGPHNLDIFKLAEIWYMGALLHGYYSFNLFVQSSFHSFFWGQIWSQNLKFFKLTAIWYRVRLLYAFGFNFYFFKIFVSHTFLVKFGPIIRSSQN